MSDQKISSAEHPKKHVSVQGKQMAYVEIGDVTSDKTVVFLHGNPTSSYLWRNIMPHLSDSARCIAPDLIGMGESEKLSPSGPDRYRFVEHREYLDGILEALNPGDNITLVIHDWGSALGFDWARRHPDRVKGIAYMEAIVRPLSWDEWSEAARDIFKAFRSPAGEEMILKNNIFVERVLNGSVLRDLTEEEMTVYRRPFSEEGESRRPTLTWPRQIPLEGEPEDVVAIVEDYAKFMAETDMPKLFINAEPGAILTGVQRDFCRSWKNQTEVTVKGIHFVQEDSPNEIGEAIANWQKSI
ncbi:MAG: haloalkane dehalogenase [Parvularculales bacterium]